LRAFEKSTGYESRKGNIQRHSAKGPGFLSWAQRLSTSK
jgi:hypothetical protein